VLWECFGCLIFCFFNWVAFCVIVYCIYLTYSEGSGVWGLITQYPGSFLYISLLLFTYPSRCASSAVCVGADGILVVSVLPDLSRSLKEILWACKQRITKGTQKSRQVSGRLCSESAKNFHRICFYFELEILRVYSQVGRVVFKRQTTAIQRHREKEKEQGGIFCFGLMNKAEAGEFSSRSRGPYVKRKRMSHAMSFGVNVDGCKRCMKMTSDKQVAPGKCDQLAILIWLSFPFHLL